MTSIRIRLLIGFLSIIALMGAVSVALIFVSSGIQSENQRNDDALYLEFGLIGRTETLIRTFNDFRNAPSTARGDAYTTARGALLADVARIGDIAASGGSRPAVSGVRSTIASLIAATDAGMEGVRNKNQAQADQALGQAGRIRTFISDNVATVVLEELEVSRAVRAEGARRNRLVLVLGVVVLIATGAASAAYGLILSRRISTPLTQLTIAAERIASGSYDVTIDERLLGNTDEIGSLARSFNAMASSLRTTIGGLKDANEKATQAQHDLESKNELLEKLNHLFMTREGRITELKQEIVRLGGTSADKGIDGPPTSKSDGRM